MNYVLNGRNYVVNGFGNPTNRYEISKHSGIIRYEGGAITHRAGDGKRGSQHRTQ